MDKNKIGIQMMQEGKWEEAAKAFVEAIEENPTDAVGYINFGNLLSAVGDDEKALKFFEKAIELGGGGPAYYSIGTRLFAKQQFEEAKNMFEQALKNGLESSDNYFMLGLSLVNLGQQRLALPYLQRSTELNENDIEALFQYSLCLAQSDCIDEAIEQLKKVTELDSNHADAFYNLGVAYAFKEEKEKALTMLDKALEIQPDHQLAINTKQVLEASN